MKNSLLESRFSKTAYSKQLIYAKQLIRISFYKKQFILNNLFTKNNLLGSLFKKNSLFETTYLWKGAYYDPFLY